MFCGKCGSSIPDGAKFCPSCGNAVEMPAQATPVEEAVIPAVESVVPAEEPVAPVEEPAVPVEEPIIPVEEPVAPVAEEPVAQSIPAAAPAQSIPYSAPVQSANSGTYQQPAANAYPSYAPVPAGKKQKKNKTGKKSKAPVVICIILAVILAVGVAAVCMWQSIARSILGEAGFYAWREAKTLNKVFSVEGIDTLGDNENVNAVSKVNLKANDGVYDKAFDAISADVDFSYSDEEEKAVATVGLVAEDETKVEANLSFEDGKLGISVPALTDETFYTDLEFLDFDDINLDYETIGKELLGIYKQIDAEHIKSNTVVTKENINGLKCRCVTLTVDGEEAAELLVDLLTAIKDDDALIDSLDPAFKAVYEAAEKMNSAKKLGDEDEKTYEDYKKEFLNGFDDMIKEIKKSVGEDEDVTLVISYASDSKGYIANRKIVFTSDGETVFSVNVDSNAAAKVIGVDIISEENKTDFAVIRSDSSKGVDFHIFGKSVTLSDGEEDDGSSFEIFLNDIKAEKINNVNVLLGFINANITPIINGKENEDSVVNISLRLENNSTYDIIAKYEMGKYAYEMNIASSLSSGTDFTKFVKPDKEGLTNFNEFIESMSDKYEDVATDILEDVDPALLLQISKKAQIKDCEAREKLIEENLVKYLKKGNGGKAFKKVSDVLAKQAAFDKMFDEGHPPYCTCGGSSGTRYEIYVYSDLTYSIKCRNTKCPNYGKGPATKK